MDLWDLFEDKSQEPVYSYQIPVPKVAGIPLTRRFRWVMI